MNAGFLDDSGLEDAPCPMGCPPSDSILFEAADRLHGLPGSFKIVRCEHCGLMRTNPRPHPGKMADYYPNSYGPHQYTRVKSAAVHKAVQLQAAVMARRRLKKLMPLHTTTLPDLPPGRMLELGCASGAFMYQMQLKGWQVHGIETSVLAAERARQAGLDVFTGSLEQAPEPERPFDLVVAWMVLEHLHRPLETLRRLLKWTRPGGWLVFSVPNAGSMDFRLFKQRWYALQVPTHLYHFTPASITMLLSKSNWRTEKIFHQRVLSNYFASAGYLVQDKIGAAFLAALLLAYPERAGLLHYFFYPLAWALALAGQTGRMTIWARKENW